MTRHRMDLPVGWTAETRQQATQLGGDVASEGALIARGAARGVEPTYVAEKAVLAARRAVEALALADAHGHATQPDPTSLLADLGRRYALTFAIGRRDLEQPATPPPSRRLARGACTVCGADVALRKGGQVREHRDHRHELYGTGRAAEVPVCAGAGRQPADRDDEGRDRPPAKQIAAGDPRVETGDGRGQ